MQDLNTGQTDSELVISTTHPTASAVIMNDFSCLCSKVSNSYQVLHKLYVVIFRTIPGAGIIIVTIAIFLVLRELSKVLRSRTSICSRETSLVVRWLALCASTAGGVSSIPGQ